MPPKKKAEPKTAVTTTAWKSVTATDVALDKFKDLFAKEMGPGVLTSTSVIEPYKVIPTGSIALDYAIKIGGLPLGRVCEMWGPEHAGKTTLAMLCVASAQRTYPDKVCGWIDMEQTFDKKWAQTLGVNLDRLLLVEHPHTAEDVADATKRLVLAGFCSLVVLDSVGGMISRAEFEKESGETTVANVPRIVTRMVKQCSAIGAANETTTLVINQVRAVIGAAPNAPTESTGGGWALKHTSSLKIKVQRGSAPKTITVDNRTIPVGFEIAAKIEKNKCAPYGTVANFWLLNQKSKWGEVGVDIVPEAYDFGLKIGLIGGKGTAWNTVNGERFNGKEPTVDYLREHPEVVQEIRTKVLETLASELHDESDDDAGMSDDPFELATL